MILDLKNKVGFWLFSLLLGLLLTSCYGHSQSTPEAVVDTFARSMAAMDIETAASCFEYGEEMLSLMTGVSDISVMQDYITAAKESQLLPDITYEIVSTDIQEDRGSIRVIFTSRFNDGETVHESSTEEVFPVYFHEGQWWIGEGYSKSEREMARRGKKFLEKIGSLRNRY